MPDELEPGLPSRLAAFVLVTLAALSPWPFGSVQPWALWTLCDLALAGVVAALLVGAARGGVVLPAVPAWPLAGFVAVAALQLVPLPPGLHARLAPGSAAIWHPADPVAAAVLGSGPHPLSIDPATTLHATALVFALALLAVLAAPALARPGAGTRAVGALAAVGFALAAYAIFARAHFGALLYGRYSVPTVNPFGPFVNKNHFAGWVAMAAPLAAGLALGLADRARRGGRDWTASSEAGGVVLAMVAAVAMALAGLVSLSRGGAAALAAGAACLLALRALSGRARGGRSGVVPSVVLAAVVAATLLAVVPPEAHERLRTLAGASFRLDTWRDSLRLFGSSPAFGQGLGAFHDAYPPFKRGHGLVRVEHAENDYLEILSETGLVGFAFAASALVLLLARAGRGAAEGGDLVVRGIGLGAVGGLAALAVHSCVDFDLRIPSNAVLAAVLAATAAAAAGERHRRLGPPALLLLAGTGAALLVATGRLPQRPGLLAREEARLAGAATSPEVRARRLERVDAELTAALRRRPGQAESWLMLAGTRAARGDRAQGAALARRAASLDPERPDLQEVAARILDAAVP